MVATRPKLNRSGRPRAALAAIASLLFALATVNAPGNASERTVHAFGPGADGAKPAAPLIVDASGALYGTTVAGGSGDLCAGGCGTVFKLTPAAHGFSETVIHNFAGDSDGAAPYGGLIADAGGDLYGTTAAGGGSGCGNMGCGTVYKLTPAKNGYVESVVYSFAGGNDGSAPRFGTLAQDATGALYGTTSGGGGLGCRGLGCGTVFKLTPHRAGFVESVLYRFAGGGDGIAPLYGVIEDSRGILYGTTSAGGNGACARGYGCGIVFALVPLRGGYSESVLYRFTGEADGAGPNALTGDVRGVLYGTTVARGSARNGTVFSLTPGRTGYVQSTLFSFGDGATGSAPAGHLLFDASGALYGTTLAGGSYGNGTVYKLMQTRAGWRETVLYEFKAGSGDGGWPQAGLVADAGGRLFGTLSAGGSTTCGGFGCGAVFEVR